jgi:hypothetical protein
MNISTLIKELQKIKAEHGNLEVLGSDSVNGGYPNPKVEVVTPEGMYDDADPILYVTIR